MNLGKTIVKKVNLSSVCSLQKVVAMSGMGGRNAPESVVAMQRNEWTVWSGMGGRFAAEYAILRILGIWGMDNTKARTLGLLSLVHGVIFIYIGLVVF